MIRFLLIVLMLLTWASAPTAQVPKHVYLTPVDGAGTDISPLHSRCLGIPGMGNINLRPWGIDRYLCASDVLPKDMTGVTELGASFDASLSGARKTTLNILSRKTLAATNVQDAIAELLKDRLRPGKDGKIKIHLGGEQPIYQRTAWVPFEDGGLVADASNAALKLIEPTLAWAASIAEDWNCSDNASLTCDLTWTEYLSTNFSITSNQVVGNGGSSVEARADSAMATDDHEATVEIVANTLGAAPISSCGPIIRQPGDTTRTYYSTVSVKESTGDIDYHALTERVSGTAATLATDLTDFTANETLTVRADGSSISGYRNGILLLGPVTDMSIDTNVYTGVRHGVAGAGSSCTIDNFSAQDYVASSVRPRGEVVIQ